MDSKDKNKLIECVTDLLKLQYDWDSYGARPIDPEIVREVIEFINDELETDSIPHVVPLNSGSIQLEWPDYLVIVFKCNQQYFHYNEENHKLPQDYNILRSIIKGLNQNYV